MTEKIFNSKPIIKLAIFIPILLILCTVLCISIYAQDNPQEDVKRSIQITNPKPDFVLRIRAEKELEYLPGKKIILSFNSSKDAYVTIYQYTPEGEVRIIFPNQKTPHEFVDSERLYQVEVPISSDSELGTGYIQGFATTRNALLQDRERGLLNREVPLISADFMKFTADLLHRIRSISQSQWVSTGVLEYSVVRPRNITGNTGNVMAMSFPQGAEVYLDGKYQGVAPKRIEDIPTGQYMIEFFMSGYETWSRTITVSTDRITRVEAHMEEQDMYGKILVSCDQPNAIAFVDGKEYGKIPPNGTLLIGELKEGIHELTVMKPGSQEYRTSVQTVEVFGGETVSVHVSLSKK